MTWVLDEVHCDRLLDIAQARLGVDVEYVQQFFWVLRQRCVTKERPVDVHHEPGGEPDIALCASLVDDELHQVGEHLEIYFSLMSILCDIASAGAPNLHSTVRGLTYVGSSLFST